MSNRISEKTKMEVTIVAASGRELQKRELMDSEMELHQAIENLTAQLTAKDEMIGKLQEQIEYLLKKLYGTSSEKRSVILDGQLGIFNEVEAEIAQETASEPAAEEETVTFTAKSRKPKTLKEELLKGVPVQEQIIELPESERFCQDCGAEMKPAGKKFIRDEWQFKPAKLVVNKIYAQTYYCPECKKEANKKESDTSNTLVTAPVPEALIPHSMATEAVVAHAMYQKYANAVPLNRQEKDWAQYGAKFTRALLARWINVCSNEYLTVVYDYILRLLLQRSFLMADETRIQVLKEPDRAAETDSFMWLIRSGEDGLPPLIYYGYTETRAKYNAASFLKGFTGYLTTDGYQGYNNLPGITRTCCWAHVRRYFNDAVPQGKKLDYAHPAVQGVIYCDKLFAIERYCREHGFTAEQRYEYRAKKAPPILAAFWKWLDAFKDYDKGSRFGKAVQYALNRKPYLETYLEDGRCSFSNNDSENAIRPFCVGRKNWLFSDTPEGAHSSAKIYTIVEMAKAYHLNIEDYLVFLLKARPNAKMMDEELDMLMPWSEAARSNCAPAFA